MFAIRAPSTHCVSSSLSLSRFYLHHFRAGNRGSPRRPREVATATCPLSRGLLLQSMGMSSMLIWCAYTERRVTWRPWRATNLLSTRTRQLSVMMRAPLEDDITLSTRPNERLDVESFSHVSSASFRGSDDVRVAWFGLRFGALLGGTRGGSAITGVPSGEGWPKAAASSWGASDMLATG